MSKAEPKNRLSELQSLYQKGTTLLAGRERGAAEPVYREILKITPEAPEAHNGLALALEALGRYEQAIRHYRQALAYCSEQHPDRYLILLNLAIRLREMGKPQEAMQHIEAATALKPQAAVLYSVKGNIHFDLGKVEMALLTFKKAAELDPKLWNNWNHMGKAYEVKQDFEAARECYEKALAVKPEEPWSRANLADILERLGRLDEAEKVINDTPAKAVESAAIILSSARIKARRGDYKQAIAMLEAFDDNASHEHRRRAHEKYYDLAAAYDKTGEYDKAFAHMVKANELRKLSPEVRNRSFAEILKEVRAHREGFSEAWFKKWSQPVPYTRGRAPVFVVGFPRSGTTLLDVILGAHPDVKVMEERPTTNYLGARAMSLTGGAMDGLKDFDEKTVLGLQDFYFEKAREFADLKPLDTLVDKMPMAMIYLDIVHRVFPNAKIIMVLRHPCDSILSCFMQNFVPSRIAVQMLDLKSTATLYAETMALFEQFRAVMPMDLHIVKYENLVIDPEGEMRKVFQFIDLPWDAGVMNYNKKGSKHLVTSASYAQVTKPIYKNAAGRWEKYGKHLEIIFPIIREAAERFGYKLDQR